MAPTRFCGETVQSELEAILASGHRQVAARIALYCSELVEAAREDERQQLRDRQLAAGAGGQTGDGTGLRPSPEAAQKSAEAAQKLAQQPTLDQFHTDRATDRDCVWILRTAFSIRNKVIQRGKDEGAADAAEAQATRSRAVSMSKKQQPAVLDPNLVERISFFRRMVQSAIRLWQETLLDDTPSLSRRATVCPGVLQSKAARIDESESPHAGAGGQSPYRHLISSSSTLSAKNLELEAEPTGDRTVASSVKPATPKSRRELHEDLGRELEQLAKDLRNAQIIKSY